MSSYDIIQSNFQAGELSPLFSGRSTSQLYNYGMKKAENVLPLKVGGARRRPGTLHAGKMRQGKDSQLLGTDRNAHNLFFVDNGNSTNNMLQVFDFSTRYLRIYDYQTTNVTRTFPEWDSPQTWTEIDLSTLALYEDHPRDVQMVQIGTHNLFLIDNTVCEIFYREQSEDPDVQTGWIVEPLSFTGTTNFYIQRIAAMDGRLIILRNDTLMLSKAPDYSLNDPYQYTDFTLGTDPGSAISITSDKFDRLNTWILPHTKLLAGSGMGVVSSVSDSIAPETFYMKQILTTATASVTPKTLGSSVYMLSSSKRSILVMVYSNETQSFYVRDITENAQHLFTSDIRSFEILEGAEDILWVLLENGSLLSCSMTQAGEIGTYGWATHFSVKGR